MMLGRNKGEYNPAGAFVPIGENTKGEQISLAGRIQSSRPIAGGGYATGVQQRSDGVTNSSYNRSGVSATLDKPVRVASSEASQTSDTMSPKESVDLLAKYRKAPVNTDLVSSAGDTVTVRKTLDETVYVAAQASAEDLTSVPEYKLIGEAFDCYIIVEYNGELLIIDKHAAHERIIFEDLKRGRNNDSRIGSQQLLLPITVILTPDEVSSCTDNADELKKLGFDFCAYDKSCDITAIPDSVSPSDTEGLFVSMLGELASGEGNPENSDELRRERALYQLACKAAIKGGRVYDASITNWLVSKVLMLPDITVCPHGRPIAYVLKKSELDRQFDRIK